MRGWRFSDRTQDKKLEPVITVTILVEQSIVDVERQKHTPSSYIQQVYTSTSEPMCMLRDLMMNIV